MTKYLTDNEIAEAEKIINKVIDYWLSLISEKMARGKTFEDALKDVKEEILNA